MSAQDPLSQLWVMDQVKVIKALYARIEDLEERLFVVEVRVEAASERIDDLRQEILDAFRPEPGMDPLGRSLREET